MSGLCKPTLFTTVIVSLLLSSSFWIVTGNIGKPLKIFQHERSEQQKLARVDLDNEDLHRALEEMRRWVPVPEHTGYLFVDILLEIGIMLFKWGFKYIMGNQYNPAISEGE